MKQKNKISLIFVISFTLLVLFFVISLAVGAEKINLWTALTDSSDISSIILFKLRLPRSLLVLLTGVLLGGSGAVFQLFFRNPLAEPGIMGISAGATLGAVLAEMLGLGSVVGLSFIFKFISPVSFFAFGGAVLSALLVIALAFAGSKIRQSSSVMILLCGTALGTLYSAISSMIILMSKKEMRSIYSWILGSFNGRGWKELLFILIPSAVALVLMFFLSGPLDLLSGGEQNAKALGLNVKRTRVMVLFCGALAVSGAVCAGGTIGFVGLIAPHIVRKSVGAKGKILIPFSMIFGAVLLLISDTLARVVMAPGEIPAGIITSILGVPFFLSLILAEKK